LPLAAALKPLAQDGRTLRLIPSGLVGYADRPKLVTAFRADRGGAASGTRQQETTMGSEAAATGREPCNHRGFVSQKTPV